MKLEIFQVDAFSGEAFSGNPAAVCLLPPSVLAAMTDELRQAIAAEMNLSETAYLEPIDPSTAEPDAFQKQGNFKLRWFTPAAEVPLCGHATLAAAATLFSECGNPSSTLHFQTLSGVLSVSRNQAQDSRSMLQMSLPLSAATDPLPAPLQPASQPTTSSSGGNVSALLKDNSGLERLLCSLLPDLLQPAATAATTAAIAPPAAAQQLADVVEQVGFVSRLNYLLVVLKRGTGRARLCSLRPDAGGLKAAVTAQHMTGIIVAAQSEEGEPGGYDFYSRFFAPWVGIVEDPVTGSAHAVLAPYYSSVLGKQQLLARQCSQRGGDVWMDLAEPGRVLVSGQATVVMAAVLRLPDA